MTVATGSFRKMNGQRVIVTGATSGIGKEIARGLVQGGASVAIVGRNPAKLAATVDELGGGAGSAAAAPRVKIDTYTADLSELTAVRALAAELHVRESHINVLVNNAGINLGGGAPTSDGYDPMLATNYLSPWLLTNLVLDLLAAGRPARIVNVASEAHRIADRIDPAHLTTFDTT
ncbi:MAG: retinol dehydrogenase 12, partial [Acidimicrobiaceae bacterium]